MRYKLQQAKLSKKLQYYLHSIKKSVNQYNIYIIEIPIIEKITLYDIIYIGLYYYFILNYLFINIKNS